MPTTYAYKVRDRSGKTISGSLDAENTALVANKLRQMGYVPISIDKTSAGMKTEINIPGLSNRVKLKEIAVFSRQFATMINSGLTLTRSLSILAGQTENKHFAAMTDQIRVDVENGSSLSQAMSKHPKVFNRLYIAMVRAGESGGSLDHTLLQLSSTLEKQVELRGKIRSALAYPVSVMCLVLVILTAMLVFIVPIFAKMYKGLGATLPIPTQILVTVSGIAAKAFPVVVALGIVAFFSWKKWVATESGRYTWDKFKLRLPIAGMLVKKTAMTRFSSTLSELLRSGVPLLESLEITMDTVNNAVVAKGIRAVQEGAKQGDVLTRALAEHPVFPHMLVQMMAVGEETGALDDMLAKVAMFYQQEVEATVDSLTSLLEPLMIVVLGSVVGSIVISLYLPMFDIYKAVQNSK